MTFDPPDLSAPGPLGEAAFFQLVGFLQDAGLKLIEDEREQSNPWWVGTLLVIVANAVNAGVLGDKQELQTLIAAVIRWLADQPSNLSPGLTLYEAVQVRRQLSGDPEMN